MKHSIFNLAAKSILLFIGLSFSLLSQSQLQYDHSNKNYKSILGEKIAYVDVGTGDPVVFLHGNPTSSYLWRNVIPYVADTHRVIAPDLIGMGDSSKPNIQYTYAEQAKYLHAFLDSLDLKNAVLVVHDWGSALGFHYARTRSDSIKAISFMEATLPPFYPIPSMKAMGDSATFLKNVRSPNIGEEMIMKNNILIDQFLKNENPANPLSDKVIAEYNRYFPTVQSRKPLLQWLREIPIGGSPKHVHDLGLKNNQWITSTSIPKLMFYVTPGVLVTEHTVRYMQEHAKNLEVVELGPGGHYLQETYSDEIGKQLSDWLKDI